MIEERQLTTQKEVFEEDEDEDEPIREQSETVIEHERVRTSVFNRLYQHAINLRLKKEVVNRTAGHVSKLLSEKAVLNKSEKYQEILEKRGEHRLLGKCGMKVEAFSDLQ